MNIKMEIKIKNENELKKGIHQHQNSWGCLGQNQKLLNLTTTNLKQNKTFY